MIYLGRHASKEIRMAMQILSQFMVVQRVLASLLSLKTENQKEEITAVDQVTECALHIPIHEEDHLGSTTESGIGE